MLLNLAKSNNIYNSLKNIFENCEKRYNSSLFIKDYLLDNIHIDDIVLKSIIKGLYYPNPYEFSVLPVEILGSIYEQFLGSVIRVLPAGGVKVDQKPEVRKAGGVYYTPQHIVEFIVENTIGTSFTKLTPDKISSIKILDPACGSGSFLLGAYDYLLNWHSEYYTKNDTTLKASIKKGLIYEAISEDEETKEKFVHYKLSIDEKKRILKNNIYGIDIDAQAVEVTKLSLALKMMEDENLETKDTLFSKSGIAVLPDLSKDNIKCGNSLVTSSIYKLLTQTKKDIKSNIDYCKETNNNKKQILLEEELSYIEKLSLSLNPFDWDSEGTYEKEQKEWIGRGFPEIIKNGGFDFVIGNPPYFSLSTLDIIQQKYFSSNYTVFDKTGDIYCLFFELALSLLKENGLTGLITSSQWLQTNYGKTLRSFFISNANPKLLINFGGVKIFQNATVDTTILILEKEKCDNNLEACHFKNDYSIGSSIVEYIKKNKILLNDLNREKWIIADDSILNIKEKIKSKGVLLKDLNVKINYGIKSGLNDAFIIDEETKEKLCNEDPRSIEIIKPILRGRDIHRYYIEYANLYLIVSKNSIDIPKNYKAIYNHLSSFSESIKKRSDQGEHWWNLRSCTYYDQFDGDKLIYPETTVRRGEFYFDSEHFYIDKTAFMIVGDNLKYLNGILSSKLMEWFLESELRSLGKNSIQYSKQFIEMIPIVISSKIEETNNIIALVEEMIDLHGKYKNRNLTQQQKSNILKQINDNDFEINKSVYRLYDLSEEEIQIIEQ